jgi:DNA (cytosine-5)-methyltransferase 1
MSGPLILSLFPGVGLWDRALEAEGFCVVRGPDTLWGGDIRQFHPPAGVFAGICGGPPCQAFSPLQHLQRAHGHEPRHGNLIPEFERVVAEAQPEWFLMENVPSAPEPNVPRYHCRALVLNNRWFGAEQDRLRRFSFGHRCCPRCCPSGMDLDVSPDLAPFETQEYAATVTSSDGGRGVKMQRYRLPEAIRLQGLPEDFLADAPFTVEGKMRVVANGVPLPLGRAIARAVNRALGLEQTCA